MQKSSKSVFIAGASGAVGVRLCKLLVSDGWTVTGTTRSPEKAKILESLGVRPVVVDVYDEARLTEAVVSAKPEIVIHQLTDLPDGLDPAQMAESRLRNARIREVGTRNLVAAATAAGAKRMVAQSIAFAYAKGQLPLVEDAPLAVDHPEFGQTAQAVVSLEHQVLNAPFEGFVLRYGKFYGPGTGFDEAPPGGPLHVDAAADAARRAMVQGAPGIYNIAEDDGTVSSTKAIAAFGWT